MGDKPIGIISGASPLLSCSVRDTFFNITNSKNDRTTKLQKIINNVIFRLETNEHNLGSHILSIWRKKIVKDWKQQYNDDIIGFETLVDEGNNRSGVIYKADNWTYLGKTKGWSRITHGDINQKHNWFKSNPKLIFCKIIRTD